MSAKSGEAHSSVQERLANYGSEALDTVEHLGLILKDQNKAMTLLTHFSSIANLARAFVQHLSLSQSTIRPDTLIIWLPRVDWRVCGSFAPSQVNLMIRLHLLRLMREKKTKQTKRQEKAGEGLVRFADQIWKIHCYVTPFDTNLDKNPCGLQAYYPTICAT